MISLNEYKEHLINRYAYEIDNSDDKRQARKNLLEKKYSNHFLSKIIYDTYGFIIDVLKSDTLAYNYCKFPLEYDTTSYISLNLVGGHHSDTIFYDSKGRAISRYIVRQVFGNYLDIGVREEAYETEEDDIVSYDYEYYLYMQGFPNNIDEIKEKVLNEKINVIFLDFDGTLATLSDNYNDIKSNSNIEKRIAILAHICQKYNCKVVIEASAKQALDDYTLEINPESEYVKYIFSLFDKYGIECIGKTPNVSKKISDNSYIPIWKEDEIRLYLLRHPEIDRYCIFDDNDTVTLLHWDRSDLERVKKHLVETVYYSKNHPEEEGLLEKHIEETAKALEEDNEIRRLVLKRHNQKKK